MRTTDKYLTTYAEPDLAMIPSDQGPWEASVVVPFLNEGVLIAGCLHSLNVAARCSGFTPLVIIVVNAREDHGPEVQKANQAWLDSFSESHYPHLNFWIINQRFPPKEGVGLARKTGCDLALMLWRLGRVKQSLIRTTDADARVPEHYFQDLKPAKRLGGWDSGAPAAYTYPYQHRFDPSVPQEAIALTLYEIHLRYYEQGLRYSGSLFAFPSMGSTLAIPAAHYASVRGIPKLLAAEDFYVLNKLARLGPIHTVPGAPIILEQRPSDRVPFGTGQATIELAGQRDLLDSFSLYDPKSFEVLRVLLEAFQSLSVHRNVDEFFADVNRAGAWTKLVLVKMKAGDAIRQGLETRRDPKQLLRHLLDWFDGLKTLQFVKGLPKVNWRVALEKAPFVDNQDHEPHEILSYFRSL